MRIKLLAVSLMAAATLASAHADNYKFTYRDTNGNIISSGSLSTGSTVNTINDYGNIYQTNTVTTMNGLFLGDAINFVVNPYAPAPFQHGSIIADNQLAFSGPGLLDGYGLVFDTANHGTGNLIGYPTTPPQFTYLAIYKQGTRNTGVEGTFEVTRVADNTAMPGGTANAPVALTSQVTGINGSIGPTNPEQFYTFDWGGGFFSSTATIGNAASSDVFAFSLAGFGNATPFQRQAIQLDSSNNFIGTLSFNLAAGRYMLGLNGVVPIDPDFTISFNTAVAGPAVPEPTTWATMMIGLFGMGAVLRRRAAPAIAAA